MGIRRSPKTIRPTAVHFAITSLLLLCLLALPSASGESTGTPQLELIPKHFTLHPGEQIHYTVLKRPRWGSPIHNPCKIAIGFGCPDVRFGVGDPRIVQLIEADGNCALFEAKRPGLTQLVVHAP